VFQPPALRRRNLELQRAQASRQEWGQALLVSQFLGQRQIARLKQASAFIPPFELQAAIARG
jgi:hypothetical protein